METEESSRQLERELDSHVYKAREGDEVHFYAVEQRLLACVRHGDEHKLAALPPLAAPRVQGPAVDDPRRKFLYDMVALTTLATRAAIEGGLHIETAYTLSDLYIKQLDGAKTVGQLEAVGRKMLADFTAKVNTMRGPARPGCPVAVRRTIEYVRARLHEPITLSGAAAHCGLSEKYLSRLFLRETGLRFAGFVQEERVFEAKRLLAHTAMPLQAVGHTLAFSSQSYFTKVFQAHTGLTPGQYRAQYR